MCNKLNNWEADVLRADINRILKHSNPQATYK